MMFTKKVNKMKKRQLMMLMRKTSATTLVLPHCQKGKEVIQSKCPRRGCHIVLGGGGDDLHRDDEDDDHDDDC